LSKIAKKWFSRLIKLAVCAGALWYLSDKVTLADRVRLKSNPDRRLRLISQTTDTLRVIDENGVERDVSKSELASQEQVGPGERPIEQGLMSIGRGADWRWGFWAILTLGPSTFIMAWRLQILLATQDIHISFRDSVLLTFAGNFFNFAMPGTTGGDIYKAYYIAKQTHRRTEGITIILLDRAIGLISFLILAAVTILASWRTNMIGNYGRWVGYLVVALLVGGGLYFSRNFRRLIRYDTILSKLPFADKLKRIDETTFSFRYHHAKAAIALVTTIVSHIFLITSVFCTAHALGIRPTGAQTEMMLFWTCLLSAVVGYLFAAVPITFQGFGLLEAVFYKVMVEGGWCTASQMLALTISMRLLQVLWSLPGVIVPWLGFARPAEAELTAVAEG
jgi:uncharacterized protein (TIRG00374 family)